LLKWVHWLLSMDQLFQVPGIVSKVSTMESGSIRISIDTQDTLTDEEKGRLMSLHQKFGWFTFSVEKKIQPEAIANLPALKEDEEKKSKAQRLRSVLYVYWEQKGKKGEFDDFYRAQMEKIISVIKEKFV
jgi:hypothetical protein